MLTSSFSYHKITLFENKCGIKLITLISMHHLKPLVSLQVQYAIPKINMLRNLMLFENEVKAAVHLISTVRQPEPRFTTA